MSVLITAIEHIHRNDQLFHRGMDCHLIQKMSQHIPVLYEPSVTVINAPLIPEVEVAYHQDQ